mmetsp:Transcript_17165/g.39454  ORF Transcript_17165/g.39454 Transcript_17165/m.39454 type:complete len:1600 (+) Transcript_17165:173-4972(+)
MGVPKFYRWISERYTKINEIVSDSALLPEFDHLYLDMNGIIHGCTHPSHMDISEVISERDMMLGIMHYLDRIITQIVKPRVSVYMAIDGVAPRAKLNQQRSRRFRSAKDMAEATKDLPKERDDAGNIKKPDLFDSNCITPGTEFMARVSETIKYFIRKKIKEDPLWRDLKVIFSGHELPGEGEHKIMEHIRMMRNQPNYQPNNRHCIYGQDADLIMLGLVTHEPHFTILREVVDFSGGFSNKNALKVVKKQTKEADFQLLHLSVLREYLYLEFCKDSPSETLDLERTIDDFVLMTFLVGNDFLPHLNTLDIGEGAFDLLFQIYKDQRPTWGEGQYLTESGSISDPARLETYLAAIGSVESETLKNREVTDAEYVKKKRRWNKRDGLDEGPSDSEIKAAEDAKQLNYVTMIQHLMENHKDEPCVDGWNWNLAGPKEKDFKGRYYFEKLKLTPLDIKGHHELRQAYVEGLMWCLAYYYRGCISWGWFFPYHYGPMLSDLRNLPEMFEKIQFTVGKPILPFQQLMSCLPPASSALVPKPFRHLMTSPDSPIIQFYPTNFEVDMNGKKNPWEGVNLLPFIEINLLLDTIQKHASDEKLTDAERRRNRVGEIFCYTFDLTATETVEAPHKKIGLTDIANCNSRVTVLPQYDAEGVSFKPELIAGTQIPYPGFPSLNVLPITSAELTPIAVKCFGFPSKYPTMVLNLHQMPKMPPVEALADNLLNRSLFINWPMMHEGKVCAISDEKTEVYLHKGKKKVKKWNKTEQDRWARESQEMVQNYLGGINVPGSGGVQIQEVKIRLRLLPLQGMKTNPSNGSTKKYFGKEEAEVPLQLALWQAPAPDPRFEERGPMTLHDRFPVDTNVVLTKGKYKGCVGQVVGIADSKKVGVKVLTIPPEVPFGLALARSINESFVTSSDAAKILRINPLIFGRITSSLPFVQGNYDLGLNLKSQEGLCVAGYTRQKKKDSKGSDHKEEKKAWDSGDSLLVIGSARAIGDTNGKNAITERIEWEYTPKAIRLINEYRQQFPLLFSALAKLPSERKYDTSKVFGPNWAEVLPKIREWLNKNESAKLPRIPISTEVMPQEAVTAVEKTTDIRNLQLKKKGFPKESLVKIPGNALFRENSMSATDVMLASDHNENEAPELGDRVVNLCASGIPFGARGTVVGIHKATTGCVEIVMDEEFVGGTTLQGLCSNFRGKLAVWAHLMRITVENNKEITDKHIAQRSGKAFTQKMLSGIETQIVNETKSNIVKNKYPVVASPSRHGSAVKQRAMSSGKTRAESSGRAKQAGWREAVGPPEKGIGFKGMRKGKSGITQWRAFISNESKKKSAQSVSNESNGKSNELKAMLGVTPSPASHLKAMLGVDSNSAPAPPQVMVSQPNDPTASLKAVLKVGSSDNPIPPPEPPSTMNNGFPPPPPVPPSAADQLLQLMAKQQHPQPHMQAAMSGGSSFNFAYTVEGEKERAQPRQMNVPQPPPQGMPMGFPPQAIPVMPPNFYMGQPMPIVGHSGMPLSTMPVMAQQLPTIQSYPVTNGVKPNAGSTTRNETSTAVISEEEFPPLGAITPVKEKQNSVSKSEDPPSEEELPAKPKAASRMLLVPSKIKAGKK